MLREAPHVGQWAGVEQSSGESRGQGLQGFAESVTGQLAGAGVVAQAKGLLQQGVDVCGELHIVRVVSEGPQTGTEEETMLETLSVHPRICEQIRSGPLGRWVDDFVDALAGLKFATSTIRRHVRAAAIFSDWLDQQDVAATDIDETLVGRFVSGLRRQRSSTRASGRQSEVAGGVRLLAAHLWAREVAARRRPAARCEADQWLERFDDHLVHVHGLVVGTRQTYGRYAAALLAECAGTPTPDWFRLTVPTIAAFVQTRANRLGPSARRSPVTATRAFLRFLATRGVIPAGIEGAVPTVREWKHAALPRAVAAEDVQRVLAAVDETRPSGLRDRAILLLLIWLGLRAGEVAALAVTTSTGTTGPSV